MTRGLGGGIRCQAWTRLGLMWGLWGEERQKKKRPLILARMLASILLKLNDTGTIYFR